MGRKDAKISYIEDCSNIMVRHVHWDTLDDKCTISVLSIKMTLLVVHGIGTGNVLGAGRRRRRDSGAANWTKINRATRSEGTDKARSIRNRSFGEISKIGRILVLDEGRRRHGARQCVSVETARSEAARSRRKLNTAGREPRRRNSNKWVLCFPRHQVRKIRAENEETEESKETKNDD